MSGISGGTGLDAIREQLRELKDNAPRRLSERLARRSLDLVQGEFQQGTGPDGTSWQPPADGGTPMDRTGELKGSFNAEVTGNGFTLTSSAPYSGAVQRGRRSGLVEKLTAARPMVPEGELTPEWERAFQEEASKTLREIVPDAE